ncbi:hypothetical protein CH272_16635 [Rhodococcus sp. 05-340-1]|nr:hypothetical protein CH271_01105 [Rhodococcus sp. 05-340-2]OZD75417.1 hypothetical protein CH272_16635 [Rhodococcus sp. 05-340-1]
MDPSTVVRTRANRSAEPVVCSAGNPIQLGRDSSPSHGGDDVYIDASGKQFHVKHGVPTRVACEG